MRATIMQLMEMIQLQGNQAQDKPFPIPQKSPIVFLEHIADSSTSGEPSHLPTWLIFNRFYAQQDQMTYLGFPYSLEPNFTHTRSIKRYISNMIDLRPEIETIYKVAKFLPNVI